MKTTKRNLSTLLLVAFATLFLVSCASNHRVPSSAEKAALSLWNDEASAKKALVAYVESVTDEDSADFIPVERRIAVFDLDGTLFCETNPTYFDFQLFIHRVLDDPNYTPTQEQKALAEDFRSKSSIRMSAHLCRPSSRATKRSNAQMRSTSLWLRSFNIFRKTDFPCMFQAARTASFSVRWSAMRSVCLQSR